MTRRPRARTVVVGLVAALLVYFVLLVDRAVTLVGTGTPIGIGLAAGIAVVSLLGVWMIAAEIRFGHATETLARRLSDEGGDFDRSELPRRPSGRVVREAADAHFADCRAEVERSPRDWRVWYRLGQAYDLAGDRRRARESMRRAIELSRRD